MATRQTNNKLQPLGFSLITLYSEHARMLTIKVTLSSSWGMTIRQIGIKFQHCISTYNIYEEQLAVITFCIFFMDFFLRLNIHSRWKWNILVLQNAWFRETPRAWRSNLSCPSKVTPPPSVFVHSPDFPSIPKLLPLICRVMCVKYDLILEVALKSTHSNLRVLPHSKMLCKNYQLLS